MINEAAAPPTHSRCTETMDLLMQLPSATTPLELVNTLRMLVASLTQSSDNNERQGHLQQVVVVLRGLRAGVPSMSRHLTSEVKEALVEIGPKLSTVGTISAGVSTFAAITGLFIQGFCKDEKHRRTGREMARVGGEIAHGSIEAVNLIKEIVKEIENDQTPSPQNTGLRGLVAPHKD